VQLAICEEYQNYQLLDPLTSNGTPTIAVGEDAVL
jgi:hypothetical protein